MKKVFIFLVLLFSFISCGENEPRNVTKGKHIKVGILLPADILQEYKGIRVFQILADIQGRLNNTDIIKVEVSYVKDNPVASLVEFCDKEDLIAIISFLNSTQTLMLKEEIEKRKIPVISAIATHSDITKIKYVSRICLNNETQAHVAAAYLRDELFIPKVYLIKDETNAFSAELSAFFTKRYERLGGIVQENLDIDILFHNPQGFITQLHKSKVDTVYLSLDAHKTRRLLKLFEKEDIRLNILAHDGLLSAFKSQFPHDIDILNGIFVVDNYADNLILGTKAEKFKAEVESKGYELNSYDLLSFDTWSLLTQALNACENKEGECLYHYIRNNEGFEGAVERISMEKASAHRAVYVNEIEDLKMKVKVKVY